MGITLNQVATHAKDLVREPVSDTISTSLMEEYVRQAYMDWCQELQWPEADLTMSSVANTQEYTLPDTLNVIFRVYINNQRCAPTTIPLLEGDVRQEYDPGWRIQAGVAIPPLGGGGGSVSIPITAGEHFIKLKYYLRGGKIGFHPKPSAIYTIRLEAAVFPAQPASGDTLVLPDQFKDGLAYSALFRFLMSDRRPDEAMVYHNGQETGLMDLEWKKAMRWRRRMAGTDQLPIIIPQDYRGWFGRR